MVPVETAVQMRDAVEDACTDADILIMNAAVADFRPAEAAAQKMKKQALQDGLGLQLVPNPDILAGLRERSDLFKVGFAAETQDVLENAGEKLMRKGLDMIVANEAVASMNQPEIQVTLIDRQGEHVPLPLQTKTQTAQAILEMIGQRLHPTAG
jgi:phosphopantothenoylcysteine decarboxylase/phosphopantothenate--cysteine ligase